MVGLMDSAVCSIMRQGGAKLQTGGFDRRSEGKQMLAYDADAYQNCTPNYPRECKKLEKDKPRIRG